MKNIYRLLLTKIVAILVLFQVTAVSAANEKELLILEAAENIAFISQQLPMAYFYKGKGIRVSVAKRNISDGLMDLDKNLKYLKSVILGAEEKNVMLFFGFTRDEMKETLSQEYSLENGALIMDYSESLLEGTELISAKHKNLNAVSETMLVNVEKMEFLLERINKFYIAHYSGLKDEVNVSQLKLAVDEFESNLKKVTAYKGFHATQKSSIKKINGFWPIAKRFFLGVEEGSLPVIVMASSSSLKKELGKIHGFFRKEAIGG